MSPYFEYKAIVCAETRKEADYFLANYLKGFVDSDDSWDTLGEVNQRSELQVYKEERKLVMRQDYDGDVEPDYDPILMPIINNKEAEK